VAIELRCNNRIELSLASAHTCSGCIIARDPHVEDEDEDPFLSDDYRFVLYTCRQRQAMRAMETRGAAMHETTCAMEEGGTVHRQWTRERVTVKRTSLSLSLSLAHALSDEGATVKRTWIRSLARARARSLSLERVVIAGAFFLSLFS